MKKKYSTPVVAVEYYQLTQAIAACATKIGYLDSACVLKDSDATNEMKSFAEMGTFSDGCELVPKNDDVFDGICYHTNANAAFNS